MSRPSDRPPSDAATPGPPPKRHRPWGWISARTRWRVFWPAALIGLVGLVAGAAAGFVAAPDEPAVPALLGVSGLAAGLVVGLLVGWRKPLASKAEPAPVVPRPVADLPPTSPSAAPPAGGDPDPGWYPDPRRSGARRYWDGDAWTEHLWQDRGPGPPRARSRAAVWSGSSSSRRR